MFQQVESLNIRAPNQAELPLCIDHLDGVVIVIPNDSLNQFSTKHPDSGALIIRRDSPIGIDDRLLQLSDGPQCADIRQVRPKPPALSCNGMTANATTFP